MPSHIPRKRFGQHFLRDADVIADIIRAIRPQPNDNLVEIGPGLGALTTPLMAHLPHFHVIELDRDIVTRLQRRHTSQQLSIHAGDALAFDFAQLGLALRVVGNLPYNISTPLLFHLATFSAQVRDIHVMLQKEVVDRMTAEVDGDAYGRLSVMLQYRFDMESLFDVPPDAFDPPPKVNSAVVRMVPRIVDQPCTADQPRIADQTGVLQTANFERVVAAAFAQRRKTLRNSLAAVLNDNDFVVLDIDPRRRAETLSLADYIRIANYTTLKEFP